MNSLKEVRRDVKEKNSQFKVGTLMPGIKVECLLNFILESISEIK
jgi:hypothetical protein